MGRDSKSPPKDKNLQFIGRKSMIRRNISTPSFVALPFGTPKIPPNIGLSSTRKTFSNGKTPQTPLFRRPSVTSSQQSRGIITLGGLSQTRSDSGFSNQSGCKRNSLIPSSQTSEAFKIPATPSRGRLSEMFSHLKLRAICRGNSRTIPSRSILCSRDGLPFPNPTFIQFRHRAIPSAHNLLISHSKELTSSGKGRGKIPSLQKSRALEKFSVGKDCRTRVP